MSIPVIAIFDIGKTNKKAFLFDEDYNIRHEISIQLNEIKDEDGFPCEDIHVLTNWVKRTFEDLQKLSEYKIKAINVSAHGASFVHLGDDLNPVAPLYNYLKPFPEDLKNQFYDTYGGESEVARLTASPVLGNLNSGMQLYWLKYKHPEVFKKIKYSLHLPEYISYLFSGQLASGITSIGCHTNLWNFNENNYHRWVTQEGIIEKLAEIQPSNETVGAKINNYSYQVGIGLHDSSAALIPYLASFNEPFILLSTGTWCISLNPFNNSILTEEELKKDCLCYLTYEGNPVKASRLFAGYEHEQETKKLADYFNVAVDAYKQVSYDSELIDKLGEAEYNSEIFSNFSSYKEAYTHFIMHLVKQQFESTNLVLKNSSVSRIFVDGGFSHNSIYMNLLAKAYPSIKIFAASVAQATAVGAAMAIHTQWNTKPFRSDIIELKEYSIK